MYKDEFDFVINATYARINDFTGWLGIAPFPMRIDLAEVLIVKIPGPLISLTVMDGPFATIMPIGNPNEYTLYHVCASIIDQYTPKNGKVTPAQNPQSQRETIFNQSKLLFPFLKNAEIITSRIVHRGVRANHEHDDSRVANIIDHGNGTWSILSGKILSSVQTSKRIAQIIKKQS
jgi:glycine/D-amino acid oxidase-like deaminating enzyme